MSWVKLEDGFYDHPKVLATSNAAIGLYCKALTYCGKHLTDGVISAAIVTRFLGGTDTETEELCRNSLWSRGAESFRITHYLTYQMSSKYVKKEKKRVRNSMRVLRVTRARVTRNSPSISTSTSTSPSSSVSSLSPKKKERTPCQPFPDDFVLTEMAAAKFRAKGCRDPAAAFAQFRNHHLAKGSRMVSWTHALATWLGNHGRYGCDGCPATTTARRARPTTTDDAVHSLAAKLYAEGKV